MADEEGKEGKGGGSAVDAVDKAVRLGMDVITWVLDPGEDVKISQGGGYASCIPEGYSEKDLSGGEETIKKLLSADATGNAWYQRSYKWHLSASWMSNVTLHGRGKYIQAATVTVTSEKSSLVTGWVWETRFGGARWVDIDARHVELPFTITVRAKDTVGPDTPLYTTNYRGALRGDGTVSITAV